MPSNKVSIVIPIIRPEKAKRCIDAIHLNAGVPIDHYEILTEEDTRRIGCPEMVKRLVERSTNDLICFLGDDTIPQPNFLKIAIDMMAKLPDGWGLVGLNDKYNDQHGPFTHWLAHRNLLKFTDGEFFHTGYKHTYCDNELKDRAMEIGHCGWARNAIVEHDHPMNKKETLTGDYERVYSDEYIEHDQWLYKTRKIKRKLDRGECDVGLGLPITDSKVYTQFFTSFTLMEKPDSCILLMPKFPGPIEAIRNTLVLKAIDSECTHLLMMDTDQIYPADTITKLMSHGKDIVAGVIHRRYAPYDAILYSGEINQYIHLPDELCYSGDLIKVSATGCGCVLYNMKCFFDIPSPWFETRISEETGKVIGEDIDFCDKLNKKGYEIYVDTSIQIEHLMLQVVDRNLHKLFKKIHNFEWKQLGKREVDNK